jgi:hypothetical protein
VSDDLATFRASQPSLSAAIAACTRPDWLIQLAFDAIDHKVAIRIGSGAARMLTNRSDTLWLFNPNPNPLETVDAWAASEGDLPDYLRSNSIRAITLATIPAGGLGYLCQRIVAHGAWTAASVVTYLALILALEVVLALLFRVALAGIVRRRAARLDDHAALAIVLDELREGAAASPRLVPIVMKVFGGNVRRLFEPAT